MNKNRATKSLSILLAMCMLLGMLPMTALADNFSDIKGHWAESQINEMINEGIVKGYPDGSFKPDGDISRAEFVSLIVKAFKLTKAKGKDFDDISNHWAKDAILTANAHGIVNGYSDTKFGPDNPITREQMAVMIVKAASLIDNGQEKTFADSQAISKWAKKAVAIASSNQLITGYPDNTFKPSGNASRAEATAVLSKSIILANLAAKVDYSLIEKSGKYGPETGDEIVKGDVVIKAKDTILQNLVIKGDLTIAKEVGDGDATLNNVKVEGKTYIRGGGIDSIHINQGEYREIIIERTITGAVRILTANVQRISITISENDNGEDVILNGEIKTVTIKADGIKVISQGETTIDKIEVTRGLKDVKIELTEDTEVKEIILDSKVDVKGKGEIEKASGSKIRESTFVTAPKRIITPSTGGNGSSSSGGSGSGGTSTTPTIKVSAITVTGTGGATEITTDGGTLQMIATVSPSNASNKAVTWNVDNTSIATIDGNGLLTAVANGTVEVTASAKDSSGVKGTTTVTISNQKVKLYYVGIKGIPAENKDLELSSLEPFGATVSYQWQISNDEYGDFTDISGAIGDKYIIQSSDVGKYIRLQVTGTDDYKGTIYSSSTKIRQTYAVSFNSMGGTPSNPDPIKIVPGYSYNTLGGSFPTVTKDDHTFHGWFTEEIGGYEIKATSHVSIGEDHTLYARWIKADDVLLVGATGISGTGETYLKNNGDTGDSSDYNIHYNSTSKTLTLNGYEGGSIEVLNKFGTETLNLVLEGTNKVNGTIKGNRESTGSSLNISGTGKLETKGSISVHEDGTIEIESGTINIKDGSLSANYDDIIITGGEINISGRVIYHAVHTQGNVEISGDAKLNIDSYEEDYGINGIYAFTIEIKGQSEVDIKVDSDVGAEGLYIAFGGKINIGKDAKVNVKTTGNGTNRAVYFIANNNVDEDPNGVFQIDGTKVAIPTGANYKYPESGVSVTSVTLNKSALELTVGNTETLTAIVAPANADDKTVTWSSSVTSVATVDSNGKVTAIAAGTAIITVTTNDGGKTDTCEVTVTESAVAPIITTLQTLSNGSVDKPYSQKLEATGTLPIIWSIEGLPSWLSLSGDTISGTPTETGTFSFTIKATNDVGSDSKGVSILVLPKAYSVTVTNGTADKASASENELVNITANEPEAGKVFDKWVSEDVGIASPTNAETNFAMPAKDVTVKATYKAKEYTITVSNDGNGTGSANPATAEAGKEITLSATPSSGYQFKEWEVVSGGVTISASKFIMPAENVEVKAIFEPVTTYSVTVSDVDGGIAEVSTDKGNAAAAGETVTVSIANIESGKQFKSITVTDTDSENVTATEVTAGEEYTFVMPAKNVTITVTLEEEIEKTVTVSDMQGGPIYAKVQVNDGRYNVTTTGIADGEYATVNWYKDAGKSETTSAPTGISIGAAGGVTVKDNEIELKVTVQNAVNTVQGNYYFTVTIDGVESDVKTFTIETANLVETVKIIGLSVPVVGNTPYDKESLSVPENAGYVIDSISWYSHSGGGWTVNRFEQGHKYQININLKLEDGYQFASNKNYVLDELDANSYEKVQWGAVGDAQLSIIFKELE